MEVVHSGRIMTGPPAASRGLCRDPDALRLVECEGSASVCALPATHAVLSNVASGPALTAGRRVVSQTTGMVPVGITVRNAEDPLAEQIRKRVPSLPRCASVGETAGERNDKAVYSLDHLE